MSSCVLTEKATDTVTNEPTSCFILISAETLYTAPRKRVVRGPKPEKFPPKYILIKRACQTQIETEGFLTVFRHRDNTQTSAGYFPTAATGNVVSWCPHQLEEEVMV